MKSNKPEKAAKNRVNFRKKFSNWIVEGQINRKTSELMKESQLIGGKYRNVKNFLKKACKSRKKSSMGNEEKKNPSNSL